MKNNSCHNVACVEPAWSLHGSCIETGWSGDRKGMEQEWSGVGKCMHTNAFIFANKDPNMPFYHLKLKQNE